MSDEREDWERDDYSESWDSSPNQAISDMMTMSGPDDDEIEAEAQDGEMEQNRFSCEECECDDHGFGGDCCDCTAQDFEEWKTMPLEAGGQIHFHAPKETQTILDQVLEQYVLVPRWTDKHLEELKVCVSLGMSVDRIAARMGLENLAVIVQLASESLLSEEITNSAILMVESAPTKTIDNDAGIDDESLELGSDANHASSGERSLDLPQF